MALAGVLNHTAELYEYLKESGTRNAQGERVSKPEKVATFKCALFLPNAPETANPWSKRTITVPQMIYQPFDITGAPLVAVKPTAELYITATELATYAGAERTKWYVVGMEQPAGKPGYTPKVVIARLSKTREG